MKLILFLIIILRSIKKWLLCYDVLIAVCILKLFVDIIQVVPIGSVNKQNFPTNQEYGQSITIALIDPNYHCHCNIYLFFSYYKLMW